MSKNDVLYINTLHKVCYDWLTALQQEDGQVAKEVVNDKIIPQFKDWAKEYYQLSEKRKKNLATEADAEKMKILWDNMSAAKDFEEKHKPGKEELLADRVYAVEKLIEKIADDFFKKEDC